MFTAMDKTWTSTSANCWTTVAGGDAPISQAQLKNTIIIFLGNNGSDTNSAFEEPKTTVFAARICVPLIISGGQAVVN